NDVGHEDVAAALDVHRPFAHGAAGDVAASADRAGVAADRAQRAHAQGNRARRVDLVARDPQGGGEAEVVARDVEVAERIGRAAAGNQVYISGARRQVQRTRRAAGVLDVAVEDDVGPGRGERGVA